jgi:hypothetical protein
LLGDRDQCVPARLRSIAVSLDFIPARIDRLGDSLRCFGDRVRRMNDTVGIIPVTAR